MGCGDSLRLSGRYPGFSVGQDYIRSLWPVLFEDQPPVVHRHPNAVAGTELALEDRLRQRVLDLLLDGPLQRPGTVDRVETGLAQELRGLVVQRELHVALEE